MKNWRLASFVALSLAVVVLSSCSFGSNTGTTTQQLVKVGRGDLTVSVSGSGKLEVLNGSKLAFAAPGQVGKVHVSEGQKVTKGDRIASLLTDSLELAVSQAQLGLAQAQVGLLNADVAVSSAQQVLDAALGRPTYTEVKTAQTDVDEAKSYLQYIMSNMNSAPPAEQPMWANALIYAQSKLAAAEAKLNALLTNSDTQEIALKRLQVNAATRSRDLAQQSLKYAQDALDFASKQLDEATVRAPFDGVVARLNIKERDTVSPAVVVAEIVDPAQMRLEVQVDEIDVVDIHPGQVARIEVDAFPGLTINGLVDSISLLPAPQSGVVAYDTRITFQPSEKIGLRPGMSASADIVVAERKNALLIPDRAIRKNAKGETVVMKAVAGKPEENIVTTGLSDGIQTEVLTGLEEGDTVVVERSSQPASGLF